jgi:UDP-N-acetylmuramate-alanine ligase
MKAGGLHTLSSMRTKLKHPLPGRHVFFVGIGGAGMAALAELLLVMGYEVSGSDLKTSRTVERLRRMGVGVRVGPHRAANADGADHVVVSPAGARERLGALLDQQRRRHHPPPTIPHPQPH